MRQDASLRLLSQLPNPTYGTLVGVDTLCDTLQKQLLNTDDAGHWITVSGIGGIGKTSVALEAVRRTLQEFHFRNVVWLYVADGLATARSGEQSPLDEDALTELLLRQLDPAFTNTGDPTTHRTRLRRLLERQPTLLVVDNLETHEETEAIFSWLASPKHPLRVLCTARQVPAPRSGLTCHHLGELDRAATIALIRQRAAVVGCLQLVEDHPSVVEEICKAVGGNPLALKMIIGLAAYLPLQAILDDLVTVQHKDIYGMYQHIFERAWKSLDEDGQKVLKIMPIATERGMSFKRPSAQQQARFRPTRRSH